MNALTNSFRRFFSSSKIHASDGIQKPVIFKPLHTVGSGDTISTMGSSNSGQIIAPIVERNIDSNCVNMDSEKSSAISNIKTEYDFNKNTDYFTSVKVKPSKIQTITKDLMNTIIVNDACKKYILDKTIIDAKINGTPNSAVFQKKYAPYFSYISVIRSCHIDVYNTLYDWDFTLTATSTNEPVLFNNNHTLSFQTVMKNFHDDFPNVNFNTHMIYNVSTKTVDYKITILHHQINIYCMVVNSVITNTKHLLQKMLKLIETTNDEYGCYVLFVAQKECIHESIFTVFDSYNIHVVSVSCMLTDIDLEQSFLDVQ